MAINLKVDHVDGLRLRQQSARRIILDTDATSDNGKDKSQITGTVLGGLEWHFDKEEGSRKDAEVHRDLNPRDQTPLPTYSVTIAYGLRNLVAERKGKIHHLTFRNSSIRNQMCIRYQRLEPTGRKSKEGEDIKAWKDTTKQYLPAGEWGGVAIGEDQRAILEEMPT